MTEPCRCRRSGRHDPDDRALGADAAVTGGRKAYLASARTATAPDLSTAPLRLNQGARHHRRSTSLARNFTPSTPSSSSASRGARRCRSMSQDDPYPQPARRYPGAAGAQQRAEERRVAPTAWRARRRRRGASARREAEQDAWRGSDAATGDGGAGGGGKRVAWSSSTLCSVRGMRRMRSNAAASHPVRSLASHATQDHSNARDAGSSVEDREINHRFVILYFLGKHRLLPLHARHHRRAHRRLQRGLAWPRSESSSSSRGSRGIVAQLSSTRSTWSDIPRANAWSGSTSSGCSTSIRSRRRGARSPRRRR